MRRQSVVLRFAATGAVALSAVASALPASASAVAPATVRPHTATGCVNTLNIDPPEVCLTINGGGLYVDNFVLSVAPGYEIGKFKVAGPTESWTGPIIHVAGGAREELVINSFVPAGNYWGYFEVETAPGKFTQTAGAYVTVHS